MCNQCTISVLVSVNMPKQKIVSSCDKKVIIDDKLEQNHASGFPNKLFIHGTWGIPAGGRSNVTRSSTVEQWGGILDALENVDDESSDDNYRSHLRSIREKKSGCIGPPAWW